MIRRALAGFLASVGLLAACGPGTSAPGPKGANSAESSPSQPGPTAILLFTKTAGFRHDSIETAVSSITGEAQALGYAVTRTEDASVFERLKQQRYDVVVFLLTTGDVLNDAQQAGLESHVKAGGGFAGVHSATDTEYDWKFYGDLVGAYFKDHPPLKEAVVHVVDSSHAATEGIPARWTRVDEWYNFRTNPRGRVRVLATVDESTYDGGTMGSDHPVAWCHHYGGGRSFYSAIGHGSESFQDAMVLRHLLGGIVWASGQGPRCEPN